MVDNPKHHHRKSIRLKGYDYSKEGLYFITICTHNRECLLGEVVNDEMILNDAGIIADKSWREIPKHFPNAVLHEHTIMPNHVHGIIELQPGQAVNSGIDGTVRANNVGAENLHSIVKNMGYVGAENFQPLQRMNALSIQSKQHEFQKMIPRSVGSIVKGFKIGVTKWFRNEIPPEFSKDRKIWQRNYHDHIIRDEQSYLRIATYVINNPKNWKDDKFCKQ